ncbi:UNVERIFIED_ORG: hypothetical protein QOE_3411, partial [Clostridioides difficile F501]
MAIWTKQSSGEQTQKPFRVSKIDPTGRSALSTWQTTSLDI